MKPLSDGLPRAGDSQRALWRAGCLMEEEQGEARRKMEEQVEQEQKEQDDDDTE